MLKVFRGIRELLTLAPVARKEGRSIAEKDLGRIKNAGLMVRRGKVLWVGPEKKLTQALVKKMASGDRVSEVDLEGCDLLPGFVESHTHTVFSGSRAEEFEMRNRGFSYEEIGRKGGGIITTVKATRKASEDRLLTLAQNRTQEFVRQGVTTLEVKSGYGLNPATEEKMLRVARQLKGPQIVTTFLGLHALPPEKAKNPNLYCLQMINKVLPQLAKKGLVDRVDIFIEKGYFTPQMAQQLFERAKGLNLGLTAHVDQLNRIGGLSRCIQLGLDSVDHIVKSSPRDLRALAKSETTATLLPAADFYLKLPYPRARFLLDSGGRVALATDFNPGSSPTQSLSFTGCLARLEMKMTLAEVIGAYTWNGAKALGRSAVCGSLEEGKSADFIVLDAEWQELFRDIGASWIKETWSKGRRIFKNA